MTDQPPHRTLLAHLQAEQAKSERNAPLRRTERVRWVNEGMAAAFRVAAAHTVAVFEGRDAVAAYMRGGDQPAGVAAPATPPEQVAARSCSSPWTLRTMRTLSVGPGSSATWCTPNTATP